MKNTNLFRDVNLQFRIEAFNVWNWHNWNSSSTSGAATPSTPTSRARISACGTAA
jgi:hypothetical protein